MLRTATVWLALLVAIVAVFPRSGAAQGYPDIRVVLADKADFYAVGGDLLWYADDSAVGKSSGAITISLNGGKASVKVANKPLTATRLVAEPRYETFQFLGNEYRGYIEFFPGKEGGLVALNVLALEDYLLGVVPSEVMPSWPEAALEAQAVAARTYAISRMSTNQTQTYDVYSTIADQAYTGISKEHERTSAAVEATAGQVLTYQGFPITAYFSADAGGYTKDGELPYLRAVPSFAPESPYNDWRVGLSLQDLSNLVTNTGGNIGTPRELQADYDPQSGHLLSLTITGSQGEHSLSGTALRKQIGYSIMRSTRVEVHNSGGRLTVVKSETPAPFQSPLRPRRGMPIIDSSGSETFTLFAYNKPSVASAGGVQEIKLRHLYAYNGWDLQRCNRELFAFAGLASLGQAAPTAVDAPGPSGVALARGSIDSAGIVLVGSGYGHGLGLSQWGAKQLASEGKTYAEILHHFYSGVELVMWNGSLATPPDMSAGSGFYTPFGGGE